MPALRSPRRFARFEALFLLLALACEDNSTGSSVFTLENMWPSADGTYWHYDGLQQDWEGTPIYDNWQPERVYPSPDLVPPVPSFTTAEQMLDAEIPGEPLATLSFGYGLEFDGIAFTRPDATAQNLVESWTAPVSKPTGPVPPHPLLVRLAAVRHDLRPRLAQAGVQLQALDPTPLLVLHGGDWQKTEAWIGTYGDLDPDLAWKYLDANLARGHEFTFQLVKALADDIFLHAKIVGTPRVTIGSGHAQLALDVVYIVDYGVSAAVDDQGAPIGYFRAYTLGRILYVPTVGPVEAAERGPYIVGEASPERPVTSQTLHLITTGRAP